MVKELTKLAAMPGQNVPFIAVAGQIMTPKQAYDKWLEGGKSREDVDKALKVRGMDDPPNEEIRQLALAYYIDLARRFPNMKVVIPIWGAPKAMTYREIAEHLIAKDSIAVAICETYKLRLAEMQRIAAK